MNLPERGPSQVRIGIAIEVPEPFATELQDARARFGDPLARAIPPHITVVGPTVVDESVLPAVGEHLEKVVGDVPAFRVHLRGTGTFRPVSPVVFVAVVEGIAECEILEQAVRTGVLDQDLRFSYHPHVTVAHEVPDAALDRAFDELAGYEAEFNVDAVWLYEHGDDGVWRPQRRFPLANGTTAP
ncbi:2'-5' RNA ligase family protein [Isoptericola variabilis]|uniref:Phosphoesterase HXTX n=1 Tax=Isoptericola variabilis (strain 225) TaxID=743718 RepID=F6FPV1_ISOV2|nr:2'-5' RNA ligase family protein [Isoptericola variabilis]AEG43740.1 Phosphoesterase HXTX [Isoptericola variabilis 225]TWH27420.1 2'-5' RNA ligase [Isoptericola variabilis J7]